MRLNAWLENWKNCSHVSDTSRYVHSYLMFSASFNSIASTCMTWQRVVCVCVRVCVVAAAVVVVAVVVATRSENAETKSRAALRYPILRQTCWKCNRNLRRIKIGLWRACGPGSSVGTAIGYGLDGPGIESQWGVRFFAHVQTGPVAHPASCTMGAGSSPGVKRPGRGADHPPPSSAEVTKG
jgi:hypothetical protein